MKIAFGNKARSGKDTACEYLAKKYGGHILRFSAPIYNIAAHVQKTLGLPIEKDPALLQALGTSMRDIYGPDVWVRAMEAQLKELDKENVFIADLRYKNEAAALARLGFMLIRIDRPNRPIDRDPNHASEIDLDDWPGFDGIIENTGTIDEFLAMVKEVARGPADI